MKLIKISLMSLLGFLMMILAVQGKVSANEATFCDSAQDLCVSYEAEKPFSSTEEGKFYLKFMPRDASLVFTANQLKVDLWMDMGGHGHGSSPVKITAVGAEFPLQFMVRKAWFVMPGFWLIKIAVKNSAGQVFSQIQIPVEIE